MSIEKLHPESLKDYDPSTKSNPVLNDDWRWVSTFYANLKEGKKDYPYTMQEVKETAKKIFDEIRSRIETGSMEHEFKVEDMKPTTVELYNLVRKSLKGFYIKEPLAKWISEGAISLVVRPKSLSDVVGIPLVLCGNKAYGTIQLKEEKVIDIEDFTKLRDLHKISEADRSIFSNSDEVWKNGPLFAYAFEFKKFSLPKTYSVFKGVENLSPIDISMGEDDVEQGKEEVKKEEVILAIAPPNLEQVDSEFISKLDDNELKTLDIELHDRLKRIGKVNEPLLNAHIFVWKEMKERGLEHDKEDELTQESRFWIQEYPDPLKKLITLKEVIESFPDTLSLSEKGVKLYLTGGLVNRGWIVSNDIDMKIESPTYNKTLTKEILHQINSNTIREKLNFLWGKQDDIGYQYLLYDDGIKKESLSPFSPLQPMKPGEEYVTDKELYDEFVAPRLEKGIVIQPKLDGLTFIIHKEDNRIGIFTEDRVRNRVHCFKVAIDDIKKVKAKDFIIVTEYVTYTEEELGSKTSTKDMWEKYRQVPREDSLGWISADPSKLDDSRGVFHAHDILYLNGKSLVDEGYKQRYFTLKELISKELQHITVVDSWEVSSKASFDDALNKAKGYPNSEGAVLKSIDEKWKVASRRPSSSPERAKVKNIKSIDVMVFDPDPVKDAPGTFTYQGYVGPLTPEQKKDNWREIDLKEWKGETYLRIGTTYNVKEKLPEGSVLEMRPIRLELVEDKDKKWITWMHPLVGIPREGKKDPDSVDFALKLIKLGSGVYEKSILIKLKECPYLEKEEYCPLFHDIKIVKEEKNVYVEKLRYPIHACRLTYFYKCPLVKAYYYEISLDRTR